MEWIYKNNSDNSIRYVLGKKGKKTLVCFGINPSTAEPNNLDSTLIKVEKIAEYNGYDGWIMFNVYPKRDTVFADLSAVCSDSEHITNLDYIMKTLCGFSKIDIWAAFGDHIYDRDYLVPCWIDIYNKLQKYNINWLSAAVNKSGAPKHPLYQSGSSVLKEFDMMSYISKL